MVELVDARNFQLVPDATKAIQQGLLAGQQFRQGQQQRTQFGQQQEQLQKDKKLRKATENAVRLQGLAPEAQLRELERQLTQAGLEGQDAPGRQQLINMINEGRGQEANQIINQAVSFGEQFGIIKPRATAKGRRVNAQILGDGGIIPAIETPEGFLVDPQTGQRMPGAILAPSRQETGGPGTLTTKTKGDIEKKLLDAQEGIARLEEMQTTFDPKFLQFPKKLNAAFLSVKEKIGLDLTKEQKSSASAFAKFKRRASSNLNRYIKEITGAQMSEVEVKRLRRAVPDPGTGLIDGDAPTVYKTKMDDIIETLKASQKRFIFLRDNGFGSGRPSNELAERFPVSDFMEKPQQEPLKQSENFSGMTQQQIDRLLELRKAQ